MTEVRIHPAVQPIGELLEGNPNQANNGRFL